MSADGAVESGTAVKGSTREIVDRIGGGIVLVNIFDASGKKAGLGSGFVIDAGGRVVTNFHVIERAAKATAQFKDGTEREIAGYWMADKEHDFAVLQMLNPPQPLTVLTLSADADPQQGDDVIAIGHPRGFTFTVTTGIVTRRAHARRFARGNARRSGRARRQPVDSDHGADFAGQ